MKKGLGFLYGIALALAAVAAAPFMAIKQLLLAMTNFF